MTSFDYVDSTLSCDGVALREIADTSGTPCYVYGAEIVRERFRALDEALAPAPHALHYALKANSAMALVRLLHELGASADANSLGEIEVALRAGFTPADVVFTGVGKPVAELDRAVCMELKAINAESPGELARIDELAQAHGKRARVAIRINPDVDAGTHPNISTGLKRNKFGIALETAVDVCRDAVSRRGLHLVGVHVHVGSQIMTLEPLRRAAETLTRLAGNLRRAGIALEHLDVGGGLGVAYDGAEAPDAAAYGAAIVEATREANLPLIVEPGRWLVAPAGVLLATVVDVKTHPCGKRFVVLDAGMTELLRPALYGAFHRIVPVERSDRTPVTCDVVGPVCESSDTFGTGRQLPDPRPGDLVAVLDVGAYGSAMGSTYNRRPLPPEVLVDAGSWHVIRRRQTIDDLLTLELDP